MRPSLGPLLILALAWTACSKGSSSAPSPDFVWTRLGPEGGFVSSVAFHPSTMGEVWASGDDGSGLYRSTDSGATWSLFENADPDHSTYALTFDPNDGARVYAPNYFGRGLLASSDSGVSWKVSGAGLPVVACRGLTVDPVASSRLFACTAGGLFVSEDFGETFDALSSAAFGSESDFTAAASSVAGVFVGTGAGRVFRTTDSGASWTEVTTVPWVAVSGLALTEGALYMAFQDGTLTRTTSFTSAGLSILNVGGGGETIDTGLWTRIAAVSGATAEGDILYVGTVTDPDNDLWGFHVSFDGGASFEKRVSGFDGNSVFSLAVDPFDSMHVICGTVGGGIYRTSDAGLNWSSSTAGVIATDSLGFAEAASDPAHWLVSSTEGLNGTPGLFETFDSGTTWTPVSSLSVDALSLDIHPTNPSILLAGGFNGDGLSNSAIHRSTDGSGGPWSVVLATQVRVERFVRSETRLYALATAFTPPASEADLGLWASDDDGATWSLRFNELVSNVVAHPSQTDHALAVGGDAWASTDAFTSLPNSLGLAAFAPGKVFSAVAFVSPTHVLVGSSTGELYESTNYDPGGAGTLWSELSNPAQEVLIRDVHVSGDHWYLSCFTGDFLATPSATPGVLRTTDGGATWEFLTEGMGPSRLVWSLHRSSVHQGRFYAGMWGGGLLQLDD